MKVLVAMSGGVDSSVAAGLLVEAGHEVVGATLKLWGGPSDTGCCSVSDVDDARRVAQVLGLDHHVFNYADEFESHVVAPYVDAHASGRTPNPCVECNRHIKFDLLLERARRLGFDALATGHHARVVRRLDRPRLARGLDDAKDQSYVLGFLGVDALEALVLPIGELTKDEVRAHARRMGLRTWNKPDSQDVCFIEASAGRGAFLSRRIDLTPARVHDAATGEQIGSVPAAELVTVGQRRGVAPGHDGERRYVTRVDVTAGRVEVDRLAAAQVREIRLDDDSLRFVDAPVGDGAHVWAQWSAHGRAQRARLHVGPARLELEGAVRPVAPGQIAVFYDSDEPSLVRGAGVVA